MNITPMKRGGGKSFSLAEGGAQKEGQGQGAPAVMGLSSPALPGSNILHVFIM